MWQKEMESEILKSIKPALILLMLILFAADAAADILPVHVRPLTSGSISASTAFSYVFNLTRNSSCYDSQISDSETITTNSYGDGFAAIDVAGIVLPPKYLCEYRGASLALRKIHNMSVGMFSKIWAYNDIYTDGNITAENINATSNVTAAYFKGNGSLLTGVTATNSNYINKTGDTMTGTLNMTNNFITEVNQLKLSGNIEGDKIDFNGSGTIVIDTSPDRIGYFVPAGFSHRFVVDQRDKLAIDVDGLVIGSGESDRDYRIQVLASPNTGNIKFNSSASKFIISNNVNITKNLSVDYITVQNNITAANYRSSDNSPGITDTSSYWLCTAADCSAKCQAQIKNGLITGCT